MVMNTDELNYSQNTIVYAYNKGYRVSDDGIFINPKGEVIPLKLKSNHKYHQTQIRVDGKKCNLHSHRLAGYCFYGEAVFEKGIHVRHLNGNPLDISRNNIVLGTASENERDKPKEVRITNARKAVASRKDTRRLTMRALTDDQVRSIKIDLNNGIKGVELARKFGVVKDVIYQIKRGETYTDVKLDEDAV